MLNLKSAAIEALASYARENSPNEAVGIIDGVGKVFLLTNLSKSPHNGFEVSKNEILNLFTTGQAQWPELSTLWHSHPSGLVGPSRIDMKQKTVFKYHLVITLLEDGEELTWY